MLSWRKDKAEESGQDAPRAAAGSASHERYPSASELGEMLVAAGLINAAQFSEALAKAESERMFIGQVLVESGSVDRKRLTSFIVKECRIPHLSLVDYEINEDLLELIPKDACLHFRVLPIDKLGRILTLAMVNPLDADALSEIRTLCPDLKVKPILCDWEDYDQVATRLFAIASSGAEISMSSFGLSEHGEAPSQEAAPAPKAAPEAATETTAEVPPVASAPAPAGVSGADMGALVAAFREGLRESNQETVAALKAVMAEQQRSQADAASLEVMAASLEASVAQAMKDSIAALAEEFRGHQPAASVEGSASAPAGASGTDMSTLVDALRDGLRESNQEVLAALTEVVRAQQPASASAAPALAFDPQALAEALRESLQGVIPQSTEGPAGAKGSEPAGRGLEELANEIREAAAAAMETVRAAMSVQKDSMEALSTDYASQVRRFNTVQPFRGAEGDKAAADALEAVILPEDDRVREALDASAPLAGFSFDSFLVSKENAFTVNIAQQIAAAPGGEHNPFFVFGPVGIGKTHLVNAVGNAIQQRDDKLRVGYASAGRFAGKVMEALHEHAAAAFREAYCHWDVLILDDIQFLGGHVEAQEEFFHVFNALQQEGRQIIIAADKPPDQLGQLEQRLVSRFAGGMVTPLDPPDYETRVSILKQMASAGKASVPEDVLAVVATRVPRDVRKMAGAMRKIIAFAGLVGQDVSSETAYEILNKMGVAEAVAS